MQTWSDLSEIVFGLAADGKLSLNAIAPEMLISPYDSMVKAMKANPEWGMDDLASINFAALQTSLDAVHSLNGLKDKMNWVDLLKQAKVKQEVADELQKAFKKLSRNQDIDPSKLIASVSRLTTASTKLQRMSDVVAGDIKLIKTGWKPIDHHIGGIPEIGLVTVIGPPKTGKTSWLAKLIIKFVRQHPDKLVLMFTREMLESQFKMLCLEIDPSLTAEEMNKIILCHDVLNVRELAHIASAVENVGLIGVDFADMLISGTVDPAAMEELYRTLAILALDKRVPIVLIAQPSGNYQGGIPRPQHVRWTRLAEALSFMLIALYAPWKDYYSEKDENLLPIVVNRPYMVVWICRSKMKAELPGAVQCNWVQGERWGDNAGKWFSLEKRKDKESDDETEDEPSSDWSDFK